MLKLELGIWPHRKRPILTVCDDTKNSSYVLAYFVNQDAANKFIELVKTGIVYQAAMEGEGKDGN